MDKPAFERAGAMPAQNLDESDYYPPSQQGGFLTNGHNGDRSLKVLERLDDHYIYDSIIEIGIDFIDATGEENLKPEYFENLRRYGFVDFDMDEALRVFQGSWTFVEADIRAAYEQRQANLQASRQEILEDIEKEEVFGDTTALPPLLFSKVKVAREARSIDGQEKKVKIPILTNTEEDDDRKVFRYTRYKAARIYTGNLNVASWRLQEAVTGYRFDAIPYSTEGTFTHSYFVELQKIVGEENIEVVREDIKHIADVYGWADFMYPDDREKHLKAIREASKKFDLTEEEKSKIYDPFEFVYNLSDETSGTEDNVFYYDTVAGRIIESEKVLRAYVNAGANPDTIQPLGKFLRDQNTPSKPEIFRRRGKKWTGQQFEIVGRMLIRELRPYTDPSQNILDRELIQRAWAMGLMPSVKSIQDSEVGSLSNFYKTIEAADTTRAGNFDDWSIQDFVQFVQERGKEITERENRRPKRSDFAEFARRDPNCPSDTIIYTRFQDIGGFEKTLDLAGWFSTEIKTDEELVEWGADIMEFNEGQLIDVYVIDFMSGRWQGPSRLAIQQRFGNITIFKNKVIETYESRMKQHLNGTQQPSNESDDQVSEQSSRLILGEEYKEYYKDKRKKNTDKKKRARQLATIALK